MKWSLTRRNYVSNFAIPRRYTQKDAQRFTANIFLPTEGRSRVNSPRLRHSASLLDYVAKLPSKF